MAISETKMQMVIDNYFKNECDVNTSIRQAFEKGFRIGVEKGASTNRPQGEWIYPTDIIGFGRCNNCKALWDKSLIDNIYFKYCPRCGARMKGADDDTD